MGNLQEGLKNIFCVGVYEYHFFPIKKSISYFAFICRIQVRSPQWNWSMKFRPSRLKAGLLLVKEVILYSEYFTSFFFIIPTKYLWTLNSMIKSVQHFTLDVSLLGIYLFLVADSNPALGHPIEFICLDLKEPAICKYCGLRYVQEHHH